ncbi:MAG: RNA polymerase subunit sigma [Candidatus Melainabacteria bacterium]|nr:MAG: RNA polymerase subunit sigma [Candidatus Melainabacteria bacterium]
MNTLNQLKIKQSYSCPLLRIASETKQFKHLPELDLVLACQQHKSGAIEELLQRYKGAIRNIVYRLAPECREIADICQSAEIKVWHSISTLRQPQRFRAWLKRLVSNIFYDYCRRSPKDFILVSMDEPYVGSDDFNTGATRNIFDRKPQPDAVVEGYELLDEIQKAISSIPSEFSTAMLLRDEDGLSYEEIALLTKSELGTVKSRISRARSKVQRAMRPYLSGSACNN